MSFDVLAILFIAFSVISSLVNKWQERRRESERSSQPRETVSPPVHDVPEIDLSEWDVFREPEPEPERPPESEFREVRGKRPVSETNVGVEFQEVRGARPISEADTGPEFRDPLKTEGEANRQRRVDARLVVAEELQARATARKARRKKRGLKFDRQAVIKGILFQEILGPPRAEKMPW